MVTREIVTFGESGAVLKEIKATLSEKITNVRKSLEDVIPSPGPMLSSWRYDGEQISIAYKDEKRYGNEDHEILKLSFMPRRQHTPGGRSGEGGTLMSILKIATGVLLGIIAILVMLKKSFETLFPDTCKCTRLGLVRKRGI